MKTSGIGGQAVMEGVMMRNGEDYAVAVRKPDNTIEIKKDTYKSATTKSAFFRLPIIRGVIAFVDSLVLGFSTLTYSSEILEEEDENYEPKGFEKFLIDVFKEKAADVVMTLVVMFSIVIAVGIFVLLPTFLAGLLGGVIKSEMKRTLVEGIIRLVLFLLYVWLISLMKDIKRTYMYHGAEHKCINCIETGLDLTVDNVRKSSRFHKRCGTSFLFIVMFISIVLFMFVRTDNFALKILFRLLLIPVISGISFEFIKLAGSKENVFFDILSAPGLLLQRLTTSEPDDDMIEVAIASVETVFDWQPFVAKVRREEAGMSDKDFEIEAKFDASTQDEDSEQETEFEGFDLDLDDLGTEQQYYEEPVQEEVQQYYEESVQEEVQQYYEEPVQEEVQQYYEEPVQEEVQQYYEEPIQEEVQQYYEEPVQEKVEQYYEEPVQEEVEQYYEEPVQEEVEQFDESLEIILDDFVAEDNHQEIPEDAFDNLLIPEQEKELSAEAMETLDNELSNIISNDTVIPEELLADDKKKLKAEAKKAKQLAKKEKKNSKKLQNKESDDLAKFIENNSLEDENDNLIPTEEADEVAIGHVDDLIPDVKFDDIEDKVEESQEEIMDLENSDSIENLVKNIPEINPEAVKLNSHDNASLTNDMASDVESEQAAAKLAETVVSTQSTETAKTVENTVETEDAEETFGKADNYEEDFAEIKEADDIEDLDEYDMSEEDMDDLDDLDDEDDEDDDEVGFKGLFNKFKGKKKPELSNDERIARHKTLRNYDEDYDESDELLRTLDLMFAEKEKEENDNN